MVDFNNVILDYERQVCLFGDMYTLEAGQTITAPSRPPITILEIFRRSGSAIDIRYEYTRADGNLGHRRSSLARLERDISAHISRVGTPTSDYYYQNMYPDAMDFRQLHDGQFITQPRTYSRVDIEQSIQHSYQGFFHDFRAAHAHTTARGVDIQNELRSAIEAHTRRFVERELPAGILSERPIISFSTDDIDHCATRVRIRFNFANEAEPIVMGLDINLL